MTSRRNLGAAILMLGCMAPVASAQDHAGTLVGWVEDGKGIPVSGALVSLFGKAGALVTFTDSGGRFLLRSLPAGSYTLRALAGDRTAPVREITVLPNHSSVFTLSLNPSEEAAEEEKAQAQGQSEGERELRWLLRHKRRSVLETRDQAPPAERAEAAPEPADDLGEHLAAWLGDLRGTIELVATPSVATGERDAASSGVLPTGLGMVRLSGKFGSAGSWRVGGLLAESENNTWRMAGEFEIRPGGGHEIHAGSGYGSNLLTPLADAGASGPQDKSMGALFATDRWQLGDRVSLTYGARYSYYGFLANANHVDPTAAVEVKTGSRTAIRASASARSLTPGGDLLTLSSLSTSPAIAFALMGDDLKAEKVLRYELGVDHRLGRSHLAARVFHEGIRNRLVNAFAASGQSLHIFNASDLSVSGVELSVSRRLGKGLRGELSYTFGHSQMDAAQAPALIVALPEGVFHDLVARLEAVIERSDTKVSVYYRLNRLSPDADNPTVLGTVQNSRFDVQLSQGLPYLGSLTRADWDVLVAFRNVFYETNEGGSLDELAVLNPPTRVLGGIAVSF